jgi:hypothetical protein
MINDNDWMRRVNFPVEMIQLMGLEQLINDREIIYFSSIETDELLMRRMN